MGEKTSKEEKAKIKAQLKKDKARLKKLRTLDKQNHLTEEETWEYINLLNEDTNRNLKQAEKIQKATFIILLMTAILLIVKAVLIFVLL